VVLVLDEIDKVKDLDELIYSLSRSNDEIEKGEFQLLGYQNNLMSKKSLIQEQRALYAKKKWFSLHTMQKN